MASFLIHTKKMIVNLKNKDMKNQITLIAINKQGASVEFKGASKAEALRNFKAEYNSQWFNFKYFDEEGKEILPIAKPNSLYTGSWSVNNGSTYSYGHEGTNKKELAKEMREMADGNVFSGNSGTWSVYELIDGVQSEEPILYGTVKG